MHIPIDAKVFCTDGLCGRSTRVVLRPKTEEVTHLVVKEKQPPHQEILVPVSAVTATTPDAINVRYTRRQVVNLQPFIETDYVRVDLPRAAGGIYASTPYVYAEREIRLVKHETVPADELAVRRNASVEATDGHIGRVDEFLVDPETDLVTHLVLREGHLWGEKEVTIPVSEIKRIEENRIYLKLGKRQIEALLDVAE